MAMLINDNDTLKKYVPNTLKAVAGELSLFDKIQYKAVYNICKSYVNYAGEYRSEHVFIVFGYEIFGYFQSLRRFEKTENSVKQYFQSSKRQCSEQGVVAFSHGKFKVYTYDIDIRKKFYIQHFYYGLLVALVRVEVKFVIFFLAFKYKIVVQRVKVLKISASFEKLDKSEKRQFEPALIFEHVDISFGNQSERYYQKIQRQYYKRNIDNHVYSFFSVRVFYAQI